MKKITLILTLICSVLIAKSQVKGYTVEATQSFTLTDSTVTAITSGDTLATTAHVRNNPFNPLLDSIIFNGNIPDQTALDFKMYGDTLTGLIAYYKEGATGQDYINATQSTPFINTLSTTILKGTPLSIGSLDVSTGRALPTVEITLCTDKAQAKSFAGVARDDTPPGAVGSILIRNFLLDYNTTGFNVDDYLYVGCDSLLTNVSPMPPAYSIFVGRVFSSDLNGVVAINAASFTDNDTGVNLDGVLNGIITQKQAVRDTVIGGVVYFETYNEENPDINLPFMSAMERYYLNTLTNTGHNGYAIVALTAGTSTEAQSNYIYIDNSSTPTLAVSTSAFPDAGIRVAECGVFDVATHLTQGFGYFQRFNNAVDGSDADGWVSKAAKRIRLEGSKWESGLDGTLELITSAGLDSLKYSVNPGIVWQFNRQTFDATNRLKYLWVNSPSGEVWIDDLHDVNTTTDGTTLRNNRDGYGLNIFGVQNSGDFEDYLIVTCPTGKENGVSIASEVINDVSNYAVKTVPPKYSKVAIRIARIPIQYTTTNGGTITNLLGVGEFQDERGQPLGQGGAGSGSGGFITNFSDADFTVFSNADATKIMQFDASNITTGNPRTLTIPDTSDTIAVRGDIPTSLPTSSTLDDILTNGNTSTTGVDVGNLSILGISRIDASGNGSFGTGTFGGDVLLSSGSQNYLLTDRSSSLAIQSQTSATQSTIELYSKDSDGTDQVTFRTFAKGTPSDITNSEFLDIGYVGAINIGFEIKSKKLGTGTLRPIVLYTEGNTDQLKLNIDGSNSMSGALSVAGTTITSIPNATSDLDKFLVSDAGTIKYRTGAELLSDIGAQASLTNPVTGTGTANYLSKWTGTSTQGNSVIYDDGTNVAIGTTTPSNGKLQIISGSSSLVDQNGISIKNEAENGSIFRFENQFGDLARIIGTKYGAGSLADDGILHFETGRNSTMSTRMSIDPDGNVGIGTTSNAHALVVKNDSGSGTSSIIGIYSGYSQIDNRNWAIGVNQTVYGDFQIKTSNAQGGNPVTDGIARLAINNLGNVGIGTTSPVNKLDIEGGLAVGATYSGTSIAPTNGAIFAGNVGIGTTSPPLKLSISNGSTGSGAIAFLEDSDNGTNYIGLQAPAVVTTNNVYTLPDAFPTTGQVLSSTDTGVMSWIDGGGLDWTTKTADIYRNSNVGIGDFSATTLDKKLYVIGNSFMNGKLSLGDSYSADYRLDVTSTASVSEILGAFRTTNTLANGILLKTGSQTQYGLKYTDYNDSHVISLTGYPSIKISRLTGTEPTATGNDMEVFVKLDGGVSKLFARNATTEYDLTAGSSGSGTVTAVSAGNGMSFTTINTSGAVTLGTPSTLTASTTNAVTTTSHTHAITGFASLSAANTFTLDQTVPDEAYGVGWNGSLEVPTKNALYDVISGIGTSGWTQATGFLYQTTTSDDLVIGGTTQENANYKFQVNGASYLDGFAIINDGTSASLFLTADSYGTTDGEMWAINNNEKEFNIEHGYLTSGGTHIVSGTPLSITTSDVVTINDVLKITPRSATPSSPVLGMIYVDSDDNHIYFYNGTSWVQMDN